MKINDVEKLLNISRANIRFYEKEDLLTPERNSNGYRDYSDTDIAQLKRIIIFRKIGVSITDIKKILHNEVSLNEVMESNISELEKQINELNGALLLSKEIAKEKISIESFDEEAYFNKINDEENVGYKFNDILNDCIDFEKEIFTKMWKNVFFINFPDIEKKFGFIKAFCVILIICIVRGLMCQFVWHNATFFEAFFHPFILFAGATVVLLPIFLLSKKHEKTANVLASIIFIVCVLILLAVFGLFIYVIACYFING